MAGQAAADHIKDASCLVVLQGCPLKTRLHQAPALSAKHAQRCGDIPLFCMFGVIKHVLAECVDISCLADAAKLALAIKQPVKVVVGLWPGKDKAVVSECLKLRSKRFQNAWVS